MSISASENLSIVLSDGSASMTIAETGLTYNGTNESYTNMLTVGTGSQSVTLPQTPVGQLHLRNLAPLGVLDPTGQVPVISQASGGALSGRTYFIKFTLVNASGETLASSEASLAISANELASVASPALANAVNATGWNVYASTTTGTETKQNSTPIGIGTSWTEPTSGLISGSALPSSNSTANVLTATWTKQGGTSAGILDLPPQAAIDFCMPNPSGAFIPSAKGGITALSLQASGSGCSARVIVTG